MLRRGLHHPPATPDTTRAPGPGRTATLLPCTGGAVSPRRHVWDVLVVRGVPRALPAPAPPATPPPCTGGAVSPGRDVWDVLVVGGGPAGLSAALMLGRCRRSV